MKLLWTAVVVCVVSVLLFSLTVYQRSQDQARAARVSQETHAALCAFKKDLQHRRHALWEFRESGRVIPGITPTDINRSLAAQKATLDSLSELDCT